MTTKDPVIRFEVAMEVINRELTALESEADAEAKKNKPCAALVTYLESQVDALRLFSHKLDFKDTEVVDMIIDRFMSSRQKTGVKKELVA